MKRVRITISPPDMYLPPVYQLLTREAPYLRKVHIVNWNVAEAPVGFLLQVWGDHEQLKTALESGENVRDFGVFPESHDEAYCFLAADTATASRALFENFTRDDLLTIPPIECHNDGDSTFTLAGTEAAIQDAIEGLPQEVDVNVEAVGTGLIATDSVLGSLSSRQREAARVAVELGYYSIPRSATTEDIASELDCAPATASEHLRRAQSRVFLSLFEM